MTEEKEARQYPRRGKNADKKTVSKRGIKGEGNQPGSARKWPTPEDRRKACQELCDHLEQGLTIHSWAGADEETVKRYMHDFPEDFDPEKIEAALRKCLSIWEANLLKGAQGKVPSFNAAANIFGLINVSRNKWKQKHEVEHKGATIPLVLDEDDVGLCE